MPRVDPVQISPLLADALTVALTAARLTDGDVDPTCGGSLAALGYDRDFTQARENTAALRQPAAPAPGWRSVALDPVLREVRVPAGAVLDLGATAKALAADRAAVAIAAALGCGVLVNLGGDIRVAGTPPAGGWRVGIADDVTFDGPGSPGPAGHAVLVRDGGLATSGTAVRSWRRGAARLHHIIVPGTGLPARSCWRAVSVAAATCVSANTASTAAIIRGERAAGWLAGLGLPARLVRHDGAAVTVAGWPADPGRTGTPGQPRAPMSVSLNGPGLWYTTRAAGLVTLLLLTASVLLGVMTAGRFSGERWPRFLTIGLHRNISLLAGVFLGLHVGTTVLDSYVSIPVAAAFVPFIASYKTFWLGLGAIALDLLLALAGHQPGARQARPPVLAPRALARLRVLAHRPGARSGYRHRPGHGLGVRADHRLHRGRGGGNDVAAGQHRVGRVPGDRARRRPPTGARTPACHGCWPGCPMTGSPTCARTSERTGRCQRGGGREARGRDKQSAGGPAGSAPNG